MFSIGVILIDIDVSIDVTSLVCQRIDCPVTILRTFTILERDYGYWDHKNPYLLFDYLEQSALSFGEGRAASMAKLSQTISIRNLDL